MTKSKLIICIFVLLFLFYSVCYATSDIDMNSLSNNTSTNTNTNSNTSNSTYDDDEVLEDTEDEYESYTPSASVTSTTYTDSNELKVGDIINICLIVIGVLLILLSVAILIRLKN